MEVEGWSKGWRVKDGGSKLEDILRFTFQGDCSSKDKGLRNTECFRVPGNICGIFQS